MIKAGKKPVDIARRFKITESAVSQWFAKDSGPKSTRLSDLADFLNTTIDELMREEPTQAPLFLASSMAPPPAPAPAPVFDLSKPDIPVWASVAAGDDDGAIIITSEPIDYIRRSERTATVKDPWAFHVLGDSMLERLAQGDQVVVSPALPLVPMTDCVFVRQDEDGTMYALVKRLLRYSASAWHVRQLNPVKNFDLSRSKWPRAFRIAEIRPRM